MFSALVLSWTLYFGYVPDKLEIRGSGKIFN